MGAIVLSPRAVNFSHGTGAQLEYMLDEYVCPLLINYGFFESGIKDHSEFFESFWHRHWPFELRGRGFLRKINDYLPLAIWRNHHLTRYGRKLLGEQIFGLGNATHCIAVVHDSNCSRRVNDIIDLVKLPYMVILYDLMHLESPIAENFPDLAKCMSGATSVFAISEPLRDAARQLGAKDVKSISFYRPRAAKPQGINEIAMPNSTLRVLVLADAKAAAFEELLSAVSKFRVEQPRTKIEVHFVGNPNSLPNLCARWSVDVRFHGFVSARERDRIGSRCDVAFLAGSTLAPSECPLVKYSIPSKLGDFAALGLPVIARVSTGSAADVYIRTELKDFVYLATSAAEVEQSLERFINDPLGNSFTRQSAIEFAESCLYLPNETTDALFRSGSVPSAMH